MDTVKFSCQALSGTNKAGVLTPDSNGYYEMIVGGLNIFNSNNQYYTYDGAKALFESSSQFMRRVSRGALRGEVGHPRQERGQSFDDYVNRILEIRETNVCVQFNEIFLDFNRIKDKDGKAVIAIMAKLTPSGPHGAMLKKSLDNKNENVCFSIRSFTKDYNENGVYKRDLVNIVTFDYVNEPGISIANKFNAPSLESLSESAFTRNQMTRVIDNDKRNSVACESAQVMAKDLMTTLGWNLPKNITPAFTKW